MCGYKNSRLGAILIAISYTGYCEAMLDKMAENASSFPKDVLHMNSIR